MPLNSPTPAISDAAAVAQSGVKDEVAGKLDRLTEVEN